MSKHLGDFDASTVVYGKFTTFRPSTGAAYTLAGSPALSVYKDNSTTQSTTGVTLTADFDSVTGLNHFAIDTSADGTFYSAGSFFDVVVTTGSVDGVSVVGAVVGSFTLKKAYAGSIVGSGTYGNAALKTLIDAVDTEVAAIKANTDNLPSDPAYASDVAAAFSTVNTTLSTIAGYIDTEVGAIKAKTDNLPASPANEATLTTIASYIDTEVAAIKAKTDNLPAAPAAVGDIPTAIAIADAVLLRNASNVEDTAGEHSLCGVILAMLEHAISGTTLTIKKTDGATTFATKTLTTNPAAEPITGIN